MKGKTDYLGKTLQVIQLGQTLASMLPKKVPEYKEPPLKNTDPMEGLACGDELENYRYDHGSFYLGRIHPDHKTNFQAGVQNEKHIFLAAGSESGKGRSVLIQNALRWKGGLVALDPKGEIASITAMHRGTAEGAKGTGTSVRQFMGQEVVVLDPLNQCKGASRVYKKCYNPIDDIDINHIRVKKQIRKVADGCIVPEPGTHSHFTDNAVNIIAGVIEALLYTKPKAEQTLPCVRDFLLNDWDDILLLLQDIDPDQELEPRYEVSKETGEVEHVGYEEPVSGGRIPEKGLAAEAINVIQKLKETDELGSFSSTLSRNLIWLADDLMREHLSRTDVSLKKAVQSGASVYIVVPPDEIDDFKNWLRVIVKMTIGAKIELGTDQTTQQTMFLLDEFPLLGTFKEIEKASGFLRGYNCKLVCVIQNIGQLKTLYEKNWETFLGNAGAIIIFGLNDLETEEYLSKRMGKILAWETSYSTNTGMSAQGMHGGISEGKTVNQAQRERYVRLHNEIHEQAAPHTMRAFIIPSAGKPFTIERQNYDDIPAPGIFDSPQFNLQWEAQYGGKL